MSTRLNKLFLIMKSCYLQRQGIQLVVILVFAVSLILRYISLTSSSAHEHLVVLDDSVSSLPHKTLVCKRGEEKRNLVYLKMHKTGSETLAQLFRRFGYARNLSFVLPSDEGVFGINWPFQVEPKSYRKSKTGQFNILCEHAVLNITTFMALMPKDTVYITSVREPFDRFLSAFNYFRVPLWINMTGSQHERQFMTNPDYFDELYKRRCLRGVTCWPSLLRNAMAFDLGFRVGFPYGSVDWTWDSKRTDHWLTQLDQTLDVVIVFEHFDESLVLLRRRMCWTTSDIIYLQRNPSKHKAREAFSNSSSESNSVIDKYYAWSAVDVQLYKRLSEKFVRQVAAEDEESFKAEVSEFKVILKQVAELCAANFGSGISGNSSGQTLTLKAYDGMPFTVTKADCLLYKKRLFNEIMQHYNMLL